MSGAARAAGTPPERAPHAFQAFFAGLEERLRACEASGGVLAVLFIDYDVVTRLDGARGFGAGDTAHWCLVGRMRDDVLRPQDILGEVARGQMACALYPIQGGGIARLAASKALRVLGAPIPLDDTQVHAQPAIGIALYPEHGTSADMLLKHARIACRTARERHERIAEFSPDQEDPRARGLFLENRLRHALAEETLALAFQPRIELFTGRAVGVECLLQWPSRDRPPAAPSRVLASVESGELINQVAAWLLHAALRNGADFLYKGLHLRIALRLPARCLRAADFPDLVDRALHTWPVQRGQLVIAFADLAALGARAEVLEALQHLRKLGVKLAMDSLGSGDASLYALASVPHDELRLPLHLLPETAKAPRSRKIAGALVELAHHLGLTAVAEGVNDEAVAKHLAELGCDHAQGQHFADALDAAEFVARYESQV